MEGDKNAAKDMDVLDSADAEEKEVAQALTGKFYAVFIKILLSIADFPEIILIDCDFAFAGGASHNNFAHNPYLRSERLSHPAMYRRPNNAGSAGDVAGRGVSVA